MCVQSGLKFIEEVGVSIRNLGYNRQKTQCKLTQVGKGIYQLVSGKNLPASAGDAGDIDLIPGSGRSTGGGNGNPLQHSCLKIPIQRRLAGCSPWDCKESDMAEHVAPGIAGSRSSDDIFRNPSFCIFGLCYSH